MKPLALYEICFLSFMSALVYVFKTYFKTPIGLSGHNGLVWVIPFIIGVGVIRKFGCASYIGLLSGLLIGTIGMSDEGIFKLFEWVALGFTIDVAASLFKGHMGNPAIGFAVGAFGNLAKGFVNFSLGIYLTPAAHILVLGLAPALASHLVFGGAGGIISAIILNRIQHIKFPNQQQTNKNRKADKLPQKNRTRFAYSILSRARWSVSSLLLRLLFVVGFH